MTKRSKFGKILLSISIAIKEKTMPNALIPYKEIQLSTNKEQWAPTMAHETLM